jgi:hypothetical protein
MTKSDTSSTDALLRVIIALMLRGQRDDGMSLKEQISTLHDLGVRPTDIAQILGRTGTYINKELSIIRKAKRK